MKKFLGIVLLILLAGGAQPAMSDLWQWSRTASTNANSDPSINWAEGMSPSSINDSARAMMAEIAKYRDDISGVNGTAGSSTAYTLGVFQSIFTPVNGQMLGFVAHTTNGVAATMNVNGGGTFPLQMPAGTPIPAGSLIANTPYRMHFRTSVSAWVVEAGFGNPYSIPLGGLLNSTVSTPPNSNFILPAGQCISATTYAAYWAAIGSPASGGCPGGQFAVIDLRGRNQTALDDLNGTPANRLTAGGGCGTAMTSMGASCANGTESKTLTLAQLPTGITSSANNSISVTSTIATVLSGGTSDNYTSVGGFGTWNSPTKSAITSTNVAQAISVTSNNTSGAAHPTVNPNVGVYVFLRVL